MQSVAPSRVSSRMQQYDEDAGDGASPSQDGATPAAATANDELSPSPSRAEKPASSAPLAIGGGGVLQKPPESEDDDDDVDEGDPSPPAVNGGGYWRATTASRAPSPGMADNASDVSSMIPPPAPRPKSRAEATASKYNNLSYWKARRVLFYKNGDPFFPGVEFRFKPGRDIVNLEALLDKLSLRMDLPRGARYIFSMDGDRKYRLDELEDGASYVVSSYKTFKVSLMLEK